ncbi:MAG: DUF2306 domain-containing protein [Pseudomonadota bacterium]
MTEAVLNRPEMSPALAGRSLAGAAKLWFTVAAIGHWIFVAYLLGHYGPLIFQSGAAGLAESTMPDGYVPGDIVGNAAALSHVVLATIIIGGGPLQLMPQIRSRFPRFHHWLGRSYITAAVISAAGGLYMIWTRGTVGDTWTQLGTSLDGVLILVCAAFALRFAIARDITRHRRWALRLFMVAGAVWFFRVGLMGWVTVTGGIGIDWETFTGPFIYFLSFGQYLVPLIVLELYFRARDGREPASQIAVAVTIAAFTVFMGTGIFAATMGMWLPRL